MAPVFLILVIVAAFVGERLKPLRKLRLWATASHLASTKSQSLAFGAVVRVLVGVANLALDSEHLRTQWRRERNRSLGHRGCPKVRCAMPVIVEPYALQETLAS